MTWWVERWSQIVTSEAFCLLIFFVLCAVGLWMDRHQ